MSIGNATPGLSVHVLDVDKDLAEGLDRDEFLAARAHLVAPLGILKPGQWSPVTGPGAPQACLGLLVLEGMICREVSVGQTGCAELVGPGGLVSPWSSADEDSLLPHGVRWHVLTETRVAVLSHRFMTSAARWPAVSTALVARGLRRSQALALSGAIGYTTGLERRLSMLFWHMADRWGRVTPEGVMVPIPLTHELIARLVGARRPSVSTALKKLERQGELLKMHRGGWLLAGARPAHAFPGADDALSAA